MPIYEFKCAKCGHVIEALRRMGQGPEGLSCPQCGSDDLNLVFSTFAAQGGESGGSGGDWGGGCSTPGCAPGG